jgi:subtilase family serine protease
MQSIKGGLKPKFTSGGSYTLVPGDLATVYNFNPAFAAGTTGTGVEIVVVENTDVFTSADFGVFSKEFGLARPYPQGKFMDIHPANTGLGQPCNAPGYIGNNGAEAILDAEWAHAAAPNASIVLAACADSSSNFGGFIALENLLTDGNPIPQIVSISYGGPELGEPAAFNTYINGLYSSAVAEGISIFVSSGDNGADVWGGQESTHGISVSSFATTPYNVAVGGTDFGDAANHIPSTTYWGNTNGTYFNSALSYIPEIPWNDTCGSQLIAAFLGYATTYGSTGLCNSGNFLDTVAGSGGPSALYTKPAFQSVSGNPADGRRDIPDVSLFAANGIWGHSFVICYSDPAFSGNACTGPPNTWTLVGGTSVSSPIVAGIMALVVQKYGAPQGNPLPRIYAMARAESLAQCNSSNSPAAGNGCVFYDVTQGDNDIPCRGLLNCYRPSGTNGVLSTVNTSYQPAYRATVGWDFATGLGTVNAFNFVTTY